MCFTCNNFINSCQYIIGVPSVLWHLTSRNHSTAITNEHMLGTSLNHGNHENVGQLSRSWESNTSPEASLIAKKHQAVNNANDQISESLWTTGAVQITKNECITFSNSAEWSDSNSLSLSPMVTCSKSSSRLHATQLEISNYENSSSNTRLLSQLSASFKPNLSSLPWFT